MSAQLPTIDDFERIVAPLAAKIDRLERKLDAVQMTNPERWIPINEYAAKIGRSRRTVTRAIASGYLNTKEVCGVTLIEALG